MRLAVLPSCIGFSARLPKTTATLAAIARRDVWRRILCSLDVSGKNACRIDLANEKKNATACSGYDPGWNGRAVSRLAILEQVGVL